METCIIVPSHINHISSSKLLICCLQSLINQTKKIQIYLSISFETELDKKIFNKLIETNNLLNNIFICIIYQERQTSQFRHIDKVIDNIKNIYKYVMFCDDDDTYEIDRVEKIMNTIEYGYNYCTKNEIFVGACESNLQNVNHSLSFHEYWSYCVNIEFIIDFINIIKTNNYDYYIDNKMCDVLFSTYLRHLSDKHIFSYTYEKLYNYNRNNEYSITHKISNNNKIYKNKKILTYTNFKIFIKDFNEFLTKNMETIKDNIFLKYSMTKLSFEDMLKNDILKENYKYKNKINTKILEKIKIEYDNIKKLCDILYQY